MGGNISARTYCSIFFYDLENWGKTQNRQDNKINVNNLVHTFRDDTNLVLESCHKESFSTFCPE